MRKYLIKIALFWMAVTFSAESFAQINFSRYEFTPLSVNPAYAAGSEYMQFGFHHRTMDLGNGVKVKSNLANFIYPLVNKKFFKYGGIGINVIEDQEVDKDGFKHQEVNFSFAYNLSLGKQNLAFGINNGIQKNQFITGGFTTGSQWIKNVGFDPGAVTGEQFSAESRTFHTISSGLLWYLNDSKRRKVFELGAAVYHLNSPSVSLTDNQSELPVEYILSGGIRIVDKENFSIYPVFQYKNQGGVEGINAGAVFSWFFENENPFNPISSGSLDLSTRYVKDQGISMGVSFSQKNMIAGFTYNFPFSNIVNNAFNNAFEVHIVLRKPSKSNKKPVKTLTNYNLGQIKRLYENKEDIIVRSTPKADSIVIGEADRKDDELETSLRFEFKQDLNFGSGKADLDLKAKNYLSQVVDLLKGNSKLGMLIIGHTDDTGDLELNEIISEKRAEVVKAYMVEKGISARRVRTIGRAFLDPVVTNDTEENRLKNRRVEFILYEKEE